ncbi:MAG: hypothetical protein JSW26_02060 [Desulfobacterales bacterium]|nr:MAG: hypothetical protein JSW26_02060 [Desulfobacterales bacterium]
MSKDLPKNRTDEANQEDHSLKLPVYPGFVFKEFLAALACLLVLAWLGLMIEAPLDVAADPDFTPNPAKAPWYFLGFQEMLLYFDPWLAGVVIPLLITAGLILIPLLDTDPRGEGYYSFRGRICATLPFTAGLLFLAVLTIMAAWFRGSNWDWYWPWQDWSMARPARPNFHNLPNWLGGSLLGIYYLTGMLLPYAFWRRRFEKWGRVRYAVYFFLVLTIVAVVIKVLLRLLLNVRYILQTPWFNI